jgi:iron complex transport system substrate-binding protein
MKFIAAFYNREALADSIFNEIEHNYLDLKARASMVKEKPAAFCNLPFKEIWYMPCSGNYMTRLLTDAGCNFLWKDEGANNRYNLSLDYETVYSRAANADYWLNTGFANSLAEIKAADKKNTFFKAFKTGNVYNNNKRNTPAGGFDFWESGTVNPDKILADLIYIFHPELLKSHELYYYQKLK